MHGEGEGIQGRNALWRAGTVITTTVVFSLGALGCGEGDDTDPNQRDPQAGELATGDADGEFAAGVDGDATEDTLEDLTDESPLDALTPSIDKLEDLDPDVVGATFVARMNEYFKTGNPDDLIGFSNVAVGLAQTQEENQNPSSLTPSEDAKFGWFRDPISEEAAVVLVGGSVEVAYAPGGAETLGSGGLMAVVAWDSAGNYFGAHQFFGPEETYFDAYRGVLALDEAPREESAAVEEPTTTTTTSAPPEIVAPEGEFDLADERGRYRVEEREDGIYFVYEDGREEFVGGGM